MSLLNRFFRPFGYELKKHYKIATPTAMDAIMNAIHHYRIDTVFDVGANVGQFGREIRAAGFKGELHSFEPVAETFKALNEASQGDANWHAHQFALGASPGTGSIHVTTASDLSSFNAPNDFGKDRFKGFQSASKEDVEIGTIDQFIASNNLSARKILLKMDTQGHDLEVLKGAAESLKSIPVIQSEIAFQPLYEGMPTYMESFSSLESHGYGVAALNPVTKSEDLFVIEMDCLFIRRSDTTTAK